MLDEILFFLLMNLLVIKEGKILKHSTKWEMEKTTFLHNTNYMKYGKLWSVSPGHF